MNACSREIPYASVLANTKGTADARLADLRRTVVSIGCEAKDARPPKAEMKIARLNAVGDNVTHNIYKKHTPLNR